MRIHIYLFASLLIAILVPSCNDDAITSNDLVFKQDGVVDSNYSTGLTNLQDHTLGYLDLSGGGNVRIKFDYSICNPLAGIPNIQMLVFYNGSQYTILEKTPVQNTGVIDTIIGSPYVKNITTLRTSISGQGNCVVVKNMEIYQRGY